MIAKRLRERREISKCVMLSLPNNYKGLQKRRSKNLVPNVVNIKSAFTCAKLLDYDCTTRTNLIFVYILCMGSFVVS